MPADKDKYNEKRNRGRVPFDVEVILDTPGKKHRFSHTHDISMGGLFVVTTSPYQIGTEGKFAVILKSGRMREKITGLFRVVRILPKEGYKGLDDHPGMGINFIKIDPESSLELFKILRFNQPTAETPVIHAAAAPARKKKKAAPVRPAAKPAKRAKTKPAKSNKPRRK